MLTQGDLAIRHFIYRHFVETGRPPVVVECAERFGISVDEAAAAYRRLHDAHMIVLQPGTVDVRFANPFSAAPSGYETICGGRRYDATCAWDMFGIAAALATDGALEGRDARTAEQLHFTIAGGALAGPAAFVHFLLPVRRWYDDLFYT